MQKQRKTTGRPETLSLTELHREGKRLRAALAQIPNGVQTPERGRLLRRHLRVMNEYADRRMDIRLAWQAAGVI